MVFKIAVVFEKDKNIYLSILLRELPVSILGAIGTLFTIIIGADMLFIGLQYNAYQKAITLNMLNRPDHLLPVLAYKNP